MMQRPGSYKVSIFGDQYTIKTDESSEHIVQAAALVDSTMKEIACASKLDTKSIAVLAALRIAHQMIVRRSNTKQVMKRLINFIDQELAKLGLNTQVNDSISVTYFCADHERLLHLGADSMSSHLVL